MNSIILNTASLNFTEEEFFLFCQDNDNLRFERTADKQIIVMAPTGAETGFINSNIIFELVSWNRLENRGYVFGSNTGFTLPDGAVRSPDASWIERERFDVLPKDDRERFAHICPDFVIELMSKTDHLDELKEKMEAYMSNGCRLGWLICPHLEINLIYIQGSEVKEQKLNEPLSGEDVLQGFVLHVHSIL